MAKTENTRKTQSTIAQPLEREVRAAMSKAIREVRRDAEARNIKLVVANSKSWSVPK